VAKESAAVRELADHSFGEQAQITGRYDVLATAGQAHDAISEVRALDATERGELGGDV
jgi:hypothetical protein